MLEIRMGQLFFWGLLIIIRIGMASTSGTQTDKPLVYDSDGPAEDDNNVISEVSSVEQSRGTVEQHPTNFEKTRLIFLSLLGKKIMYPNKVRESVRTNPITVSQPPVITKKVVNSDSNGLSSTRVDSSAKTRRPQPRSNIKNDRVPFPSKSSCNKNKKVEVEEHPRNLLLSKKK
nr:hypothetical protein [Tanacetum cinerariifolium]